MLRLTLTRLAGAIPNVIGVVIVTFLLTRALPGDPAAYFAGPAATQEAVEQIRTQLGLDKSLAHQFALYLRDLARGDLGNSLSTGQPVLAEIAARLPASLELTLVRTALRVRGRYSARGLCRNATRVLGRSLVPHARHRRRIVADILYRAAACLRLLLPSRAWRPRRSAGSTSPFRHRRR